MQFLYIQVDLELEMLVFVKVETLGNPEEKTRANKAVL